jgi:glutathione synthase/RimK-type ligase-like ATP-grasp enzyme
MSSVAEAHPLHASTSTARTTVPVAIYYEHPRWFERLFAELDRRGVPYSKTHVDEHVYDPSSGKLPADVVFNRMSPSAYHRGHGPAIAYTHSWLGHLERHGQRVINGHRAFTHEISKALQLSVLNAIGLPGPKTRVIRRPEDAPAATAGLRFPIVIKPNVGGSGVGVVRFDTKTDLEKAVADRRLDLGLDSVGLVQEFIPARGGHIVRVETIGGKYVYGIQVYLSGETFDLCPADICQTGTGVALDNACVVEAPKARLRVDGYDTPPHLRAAVERIVQSMGIDVGGVEYIVDDRDGQLYFYDVNALSNFVADAPKVIGFDPHVNLVDYLLAEGHRG